MARPPDDGRVSALCLWVCVIGVPRSSVARKVPKSMSCGYSTLERLSETLVRNACFRSILRAPKSKNECHFGKDQCPLVYTTDADQHATAREEKKGRGILKIQERESK